eukprot:scaffold37349_cov35-Attheya_sp.AAC.1
MERSKTVGTTLIGIKWTILSQLHREFQLQNNVGVPKEFPRHSQDIPKVLMSSQLRSSQYGVPKEFCLGRPETKDVRTY